jgi:hypothetical protein
MSAPNLREWAVRRPLSAVVPTGTYSSRVRDMGGLPPELRTALPTESKVEWVLMILPERDRADMGSELFRIAARTCRTGQLPELAQAILSWEATAEEIEDSRGQSNVKSDGQAETPIDLEELERRLRSE